MERTNSAPTMDPRMRESAMGDLFPEYQRGGQGIYNWGGDDDGIPWKSGYICRSFVSSVRLSTPCSILSFSNVSWRTVEP